MSWTSIFCIGEERKQLVKWIIEHDNEDYLGDTILGKNAEYYYFLSIHKLEKIKKLMESKHAFTSKLKRLEEETKGIKTKNLKRVNINDYVYFEPTEETKTYITKYYRQLYNKLDVEKEVESFIQCSIILENGTIFFKMQIHQFANIFGSYMTLGSIPMIKDNNIYFEIREDKK